MMNGAGLAGVWVVESTGGRSACASEPVNVWRPYVLGAVMTWPKGVKPSVVSGSAIELHAEVSG